MRDYGSFFRNERLTRGLRQKDLAVDLCTKDSISRIENGSQTPQAYLFGTLLERLGVSGFSYGDLFEAGAIRLLSLKHEIMHAIEHKAFDGIAELLGEFSDLLDRWCWWDRQFYIYAKAYYFHWMQPDAEVFLERLRKALSVTRKYSPEDDYPISTFLVQSEKMILNRIAITEFECGRRTVGLSLMNRLILLEKRSEEFPTSHWKDLCVLCQNAAMMEREDFPDIAGEHMWAARAAFMKCGDLWLGARLFRNARFLDFMDYMNPELEYGIFRYYFSKINKELHLASSFEAFMRQPDYLDITI